MRRRTFLSALGALASPGCAMLPEDGLRNPCLAAALPRTLAEDDVVLAALEGIDWAQLWDCHTHLLGSGDSGGGAWLSLDQTSLLHPIQRAQYHFYLNASCIDADSGVDEGYVKRLLECVDGFGEGAKAMLLAFDFAHDTEGRVRRDQSSFHAPNAYAAAVAARHAERFEWIASIHPYREDAVEALEGARANGARAVKWLPAVMGMDPASARCDAVYEALARLGLPLLTHAGKELAVHGESRQKLGNVLRLRRPLERGVRVIVAHCASLGTDVDLDHGPDGPERLSIELFARLMDEPRHEGLLFGDVSAMTQVNRVGPALALVLSRTEWHGRLLNGSDYPLPGVMPLFDVGGLAEMGYLDAREAIVIRRLRAHNPLLFDLVLKRTIRRHGNRLGRAVFETRRVFEPAVG
jgi:mannonate dehydratase